MGEKGTPNVGFMELLRLRVKDVGFSQGHIIVREGKGKTA